MANKLDLGDTKATYTLIDIRDIDAAALIDIGCPGDLVLVSGAGAWRGRTQSEIAKGAVPQVQDIVRATKRDVRIQVLRPARPTQAQIPHSTHVGR